jgi:hypothetical protein
MIPFQRQAVVCIQRPNLSFMRKLIGFEERQCVYSQQAICSSDSKKRTFTKVVDLSSTSDNEVVSDAEDEDDDSAPSNPALKLQCLEKLKGLVSPHFVRLLKESRRETSMTVVRSLNVSQTAALKHITQDMFTIDTTRVVVFKRDVGALKIIQGPPGCGKTHLLSALLHVLLAASCRVLVCAPSNKAVCVALEKFLGSLQGRKDPFRTPRLVIVGVGDKIESNSNTVVDVLSSWRAILDEPQNIVDVMSTTYADRIVITISRLREECMAIDKLFDSNHTGRLVDVNKAVYEEVKRLNEKHGNICDAIKVRLPTFLANHSAVSKRHEQIEFSLIHSESIARKHLFQEADVEEDLQPFLVSAMLEVCRQLQAIVTYFKDDQHSMGISDEYISTAEIVFCTLSSSGSVGVTRNFRNIDVLVIDEAAQAFEPELLIPMVLEPRNMVLIGDPKQLSATIISQPIQRDNLGQSCMQRLMTGCKYPFEMLTEQYRMHPEIVSFSNQQFYQSQIKNSTHVTQREDILVQTGRNLRNGLGRAYSWVTGHYSFINVDGIERCGDKGTSFANEQEANFVVKLVEFLRDFCGLHPALQICVLSFYAAQVNLIKTKLEKVGPIKVLTVDSFQGSECDCVILSFVRANNQNRQGFVKECQRLNVALTRGKHMLFGVGCARTLVGAARGDFRGVEHEAPERLNTKRSRGVDGLAVPSPTADHENSLYHMICDAQNRERYFESEDVQVSMEDLRGERNASGHL